MTYELFYLVGVSHEAELPEIKKETEDAVAAAGGVFQEKETAEKRRLSYKIKHENHGIYIARRFDLEDAEKVTEITKNLNLNARILRFLISKADDLPELKSKEERIEEAAKRDKAKEIKPEIKKSTIKKGEKPLKEGKKEEAGKEEKEGKADEKAPKDEKGTKQTDEDIDKKLEEILNI